MPALPSQIDFQQNNAHRVDPDELEMMGKRASAAWAAGDFRTLGEAVIDGVKHAGLSPEQVRRVVEFANTDAFLDAFHKLGSGHRYVDFGHGVLADPRDVIRDLNDGGGGSVFDRGTVDYDGPPTRSKTSSADPEGELALFAAFSQGVARDAAPQEQSSGWVWDERDKLAGQVQHLTSELSGVEVAYQDLALNLYEQVKLAARDGITLGQVVRAWSDVVDDPTFVKVAFELVTPRLIKDGTFAGIEQINQSIEKTGSAHVTNVDHPLVDCFADYCCMLCKVAEVRQDRDRMANKLAKVNYAIKQSAGDLDKAAGMIGKALDIAGQAGRRVTGGEGGELLGKAALIGGTGLAAKAGYDTIANDPGVAGFNARLNPLSSLYQQRHQMRRDMALQSALG